MGLRFFVSPFAAGEKSGEESEFAEVFEDEVSDELCFLVVFWASIWTCECQDCLSWVGSRTLQSQGKRASTGTWTRMHTGMQSITTAPRWKVFRIQYFVDIFAPRWSASWTSLSLESARRKHIKGHSSHSWEKAARWTHGQMWLFRIFSSHSRYLQRRQDIFLAASLFRNRKHYIGSIPPHQRHRVR